MITQEMIIDRANQIDDEFMGEITNFGFAKYLAKMELRLNRLEALESRNQSPTIEVQNAGILQKCPKCNGQGKVSKPPHIPGDVETWSSSEAYYTCNLCNGRMVVSMNENAGIIESEDIVTAIERHINTFDNLTEREIDLCSYSFKEGWFKALRKPGESDEEAFEKWFAAIDRRKVNSFFDIFIAGRASKK